MEDLMEVSAPSSIELSGLLDYEGVPFDQSRKCVAMASIRAPLYEPKVRAPLRMVCVVDRSGSMEGDKINLVKKTLQFVVKQLKATDQFAMVTFASEVQTDLKFTYMTDDGKETASSKIQQVRASGCTNLSGGLFTGMNLIEGGEDEKTITSVLLLTDGRANEGISRSEELISAYKEIAAKKPNCTLFTFGYGNDHDDKLLKNLSEHGKGIYYYVEKEDDIPSAFADCLGGLISVVAQNLKLTFTPLSGTKIEKVLTMFKTSQVQTGTGETGYEVSIGDLYSEENRNILVQVELPELKEESECNNVISCELSFFNVITSTTGNAETTIAVQRKQEEVKKPNKMLDRQKNRVKATEALEKADRLCKEGHFKEGKDVLQEAIDYIKSSISADEPLCKDLIKDLAEAMERAVDTHTYTTTGSKYMGTKLMSHGYERSTHSSPTYITSSKKAAMSSLQ